MARKQTGTDFGLFLSKPAAGNSGTSLVPFMPQKPATKEEKLFNRELKSQELAQWGYAHEGEHALELTSDLNLTAAWLYVQELHQYTAFKQNLQGIDDEFKPMGEQYLRVNAQQSGNNKIRIIETASSNIAAEVHRPLYFEPQDPTFWERLTGSWKR